LSAADVALIPYPADDELDERAREVLDRLPIRINLFSMLANAPAMMRPTLRLGQAILTGGELDPRLRELAILRVAAVTGTEYEWVQHVPIGKAVGVTDAEIDALSESDALPDGAFGGTDELVLRIVDGVLRDQRPAPDLVTRGADELGRAGLIELILVAGYYAMLGNLMRAVDLDVDAPAAERGEFPATD
jgi:alkylhydroperoxidase/carboxymuconolactone decarboxylase family protein YurZ